MSRAPQDSGEPALRRGDTGAGVAEIREILTQLELLPSLEGEAAPYEPPTPGAPAVRYEPAEPYEAAVRYEPAEPYEAAVPYEPAAPCDAAVPHDPAPHDPAAARDVPTDYDAAVELAVRHFQQVRGLSVDGVVGRETYAALTAARWRFGDRLLTHSVGRLMHGDDVLTLQERLIGLGYDAGKPDAIFGTATERALRGFQADYGLTADGTCGPATIRALHQLSRVVSGGRPQLLRQEAALVTAGPALFGKRIVIDPGHGGADRGYTLGETAESDLTWDIASRIEGQLAAAGGTAYLTRGRRGSPSTVERAALANATDADLLLTLHVESHPSQHARGVATYYFGTGSGPGPSSSVGETLAGLLCREVVSRTGLLDCGTHGKSWDLLRLTRMPAVRLDCGYLSHAVDRRLLLDARFRSTIAQAALAAIQRLYLPEVDDYDTGALDIHALRR